MPLRIGYNTNGFPFHALSDVVTILADLGYDGVALTPDVHHLNPLRASTAEIDAFRAAVDRHRLARVVETGARFVLDPRRKHHPSLLSREGSERRLEFLRSCIGLASRIGAPVVSFWSGASEGEPRESELHRMCEACRDLLDEGEGSGVVLALEPEPGMLIQSLRDVVAFDRALRDARLALTLDVGHLHLSEPEPIASCIRAWTSRLINVHLDDMRRPIHEHLSFGDGEIEFPAVIGALEEIGFSGLASVELSRHGHDSVSSARSALAFLRKLARP